MPELQRREMSYLFISQADEKDLLIIRINIRQREVNRGFKCDGTNKYD